ncbi:MAG TPA: 5-formyltetrahydrofolate cyclo-ligase [Tepidisphaeraceae bacterium]|nr:5-formyltetrahydrofolate cyclo-ligase [Tepidisphaeraceae bacterium]
MNSMGSSGKAVIRRQLRETLAAMTDAQRHDKSLAACRFVAATPEFDAARVVMLYLSTPTEVDTASLALKCWQQNKSVVVPKVSWDQRRMLPVEISSLKDAMTMTGPVREPVSGKPIPLDLIDLVIVPGLGFTPKGYRIGRGMGFYDRFLAQPEFVGLSCGLSFEEQVLPELPVLDHDVPLGMLVTDRGVRRFASKCIESR